MTDIGIRIMRPAVYTDGTACQIVLTELGEDRVIVSFHDEIGSETVGIQQIAVVVDRQQFARDALALFHRAGEEAGE